MSRATPIASLVFACSLACLFACSADPEPALKDNPLCAFECPKHGVADGNAAISGVPSADTFFQAAVAYSSAADHASAAIETELSQLRLDFGLGSKDAVGAAIRSQGADALGKSPVVVALQAVCWVDSATYNTARSQCDTVEASETIPCRGQCRVEPGTDCTGSAELQCTKNSTGAECTGACDGTCTGEPDANGDCDGVCLGSCSGTCDAFVAGSDAALACAGRCSGDCDGQCVRAVANETCRGLCNGACTQKSPKDGCDDAIEARCQAKARPFDCPGACGGSFTPTATGNVECREAALAQASYLARCDAPRVDIMRPPAGAEPDARQQRYLRALRTFEQRLPELLADIARGKLIKIAGQELAAISGAEVKESFKTASAAPELPIATSAGLACAIAEAPRVGEALEPPSRRLDSALADADELLKAFDIAID